MGKGDLGGESQRKIMGDKNEEVGDVGESG